MRLIRRPNSVLAYLLLILLVVASFCGNYFKIPLFFGVDLVFGSVATLIILRLYGLFWAAAATLIGSFYTLLFWHNPYVLVIFIAEILFVGYFLPKYKNLILLDGSFWLIIGLPLGWLLFHYGSHLSSASSWLIVLKQVINGVFNALLASLILSWQPLYTWAETPENSKYLSLQQLIFNLLVAFLLIPSVLFLLLTSRHEVKHIEANIAQIISDQSKILNSQTQLWYTQHVRALSELAKTVQANNNNLEELKLQTATLQRSFSGFLRIHIDKPNGASLILSPDITSAEQFNQDLNFSDRDYYQKLKVSKDPVLSNLFISKIDPNQPIVVLGIPMYTKNVYSGAVVGALDLNLLNKLLSVKSSSSVSRVSILDSQGQVITSTNPERRLMQHFTLTQDPVGKLPNHLTRWRPPVSKYTPELLRWERSTIVKEFPITNLPWSFVLEVPIQPFMVQIQDYYLKNFLIILGLLIFSLLIGERLSHIISQPLHGLAKNTTNVPNKLLKGRQIYWPESPIFEINTLICNFRSMADTLHHNFKALRKTMNQAEADKIKLEAIITGVADAISVQDSNFKITFQNQVSIETFGYQIGEFCYQAFAQREEVCENCPLTQAFTTGTIQRQERTALAHGKPISVDTTISPLKDHLGNYFSALEVMKDISERKLAEKTMQQQVAAINAAMDGFAILNQQGEFVYLNDAFINIYHYDFQELLGHSWRLLYPPDSLNYLIQEVLPNFNQKGHWRGEVTSLRKNQSLFPAEITVSNIGNDHLVVIIRDITIRKQYQQAIWQEKEKAQVTLDSIGDAVITTDAAGIVEYLNPVAALLTGWSTTKALGRPLSQVFKIINENTGQSTRNPVDTCLEEQRVVGFSSNATLIHTDGHKFAIESSAAPIRNSAGVIIGAVLVFRDVTEKRNMVQQLVYQAHHDALTGLPNRLLFNERLDQALFQAKTSQTMLAVLFLDLDEFKMVNDILGHDVGDKLLKNIAERMLTCLRSIDTFARLGGDEFIILLPQLKSQDEAIGLAEKIIDVFQKPWVIENQEFLITASLGIALYPDHGAESSTLMRRADLAMYRSKEKGRNAYELYNSSMNEAISQQVDLENTLRHSIEREEFEVYYQPQINISTGQVSGMEALVRWNHPERGLVSPVEFISLAETSGLIISLGEWVLRTACLQNKLWNDLGLSKVRVSVNISACQFRQYNFVEMVQNVLTETGLAPNLLELEITESVSMQDAEYTLKTLTELANLGIHIAIDDFGTSYASFNYLKRFPISTLKIDRSFIQDVLNNREDAAIVASIISLAQNLKLKVIAEGVETLDQLQFLRKLNCHHIQGYFFSPPIADQEMERYFKTKNLSN